MKSYKLTISGMNLGKTFAKSIIDGLNNIGTMDRPLFRHPRRIDPPMINPPSLLSRAERRNLARVHGGIGIWRDPGSRFMTNTGQHIVLPKYIAAG